MSTVMKSDLIQVDQALESFRDSGFDLPTAVGEVVDNSIQAKAQYINIRAIKSKDKKKIEKICFADDGAGIDPNVLASVLKMGFGTRYNERNGLGRFGVGLKLATLSQARRIDVYTRPLGTNEYFHTYLDLNKVVNDEQRFLEAERIKSFPQEYSEMLKDANGQEFQSGTLIIWSDVDRLTEGGNYGSSLKEKEAELLKFLARAYRKFIDKGLNITLDGKKITLHDPLFLMENPRATKVLGEDLRATEIESTKIPIEGHEVEVIVSLLPEKVRRNKGEGGTGGAGSPFKDLNISDNQSRISILRHGREIYYDIIPRILPDGVDVVDRYIGIEISFPAALDEYFQVRNVKRGAQPVDKLYREIKRFLKLPILEARRQIRTLWATEDHKERANSDDRTPAFKAVAKVEESSPKGKGGYNINENQEKKKIDEVLDEVGLMDDQKDKVSKQLESQIKEQAITIIDANWPGKELLDITHLNSKAIVKINRKHPFIKEIYEPIKVLADTDGKNIEPYELVRLARKVESAIDVLFMAYAKAENMHQDPEDAYSELRSYWGQFTASYVRELLKQLGEKASK
ncbi:ATP-binding protein [Priestia aryabhattai]|uniref:ATP-binding protein n=1 Tax=Priestia aryabhattai TaxID=412384 RepID=UPI0025A407D3|nr:ATP-binding protein [Priestia aryabhattai]WJN45175.1 ATP-binding protein [Priestia aryabhattai]